MAPKAKTVAPANVSERPSEETPARRGRLVLYQRPEATPAAKAKARSNAKGKEEAERVPLAVYHLTERTNPDGPARVQVQREGDDVSFMVHMGDKLQYWAFQQVADHSLCVELQYYEPGAAEPKTIATRSNTYGHFHNEVMAGMLYLFMRLVPKE
jgi:hypothetical protein